MTVCFSVITEQPVRAKLISARRLGFDYRQGEIMEVMGVSALLGRNSVPGVISPVVAFVVLFLLLMLPTPYALAQESGRTWTVNGLEGTFNTQEDAEKAIRAVSDPYQYVRYIRDRTIKEGRIEFTYWMGWDKSELQPWRYRTVGSPTSDEEMINNFIAYFDQQSIEDGCATGAYLESRTNWRTANTWSDGLVKEEAADLVFRYRGDNDVTGAQCVLIRWPEFVMRDRDRCANTYMGWNSATNTCSNDTYTAVVVSTPLACDVCTLVGNPADFSTGDKFQTEPDFDLGWVSFVRYYHSATSNDGNGGFGYGWTHNHNIRLAIESGSSTPEMGLIRANGSHQPFRRFSGYYEAADGSGDRIVASGSDWKLYQTDRILTFTSSGQLSKQDFEDGTALTYVYDVIGRLTTITHSSGRALVFNYANGTGGAPISSITFAGLPSTTYTYNVNGQVETVTYFGGDKRTYHYEDSRFPKNLTGVTNENNQRYSTFGYDTKGRLVSSKHAGNVESTTLAYTPQGGATVTGSLGYQTTYGLTADSGDGKPRQAGNAVDSQGAIGRTYYDAATDFRRRPNTVTDRKGVQTKYTYSESTLDGQPVSVTTVQEAVGKPETRTSIEYRSLVNNRLLLSKVGNRETKITRNARLQPLTITVKDVAANEARTTTNTYCEQADVTAGTCPLVGQLIKVDGPRTDVSDLTTYTYYPNDDASCTTDPVNCPHRKGDLWKVTNALGHVSEILKYGSSRLVLSVKDANGVVTDFEYTARAGKALISARKLRGTDNTTEADDRITRIEYFPTGQVKKITDPTGAYSSFTYDAAQRLTDIADNDGNTIHYTLDNAGNRMGEDVKNPSGTVKRTLSRIYNALGQLETQADADDLPNLTDFTYDKNGNLETTTDPLTHRTRQGYDALDRLISTMEDETGLQVETKYVYDALDNLTKVTDPRALDTTYSYNAFGEVTREVSKDRGTTTYTYDSAGNLKTRTDARVPSVTATYEYDALNRVTKITAGSEVQTFAYDTCTFGKGRLCTTTAINANTQFTYSRDGQIATRRELMTVGGVQSNYPITYSYDVAGRVTSIQHVNGVKVGYGYNRDKPTSMTVQIGTAAPVTVISGATYDPFGPATGWTYGNGLKRVVGYNKDGQVNAISTNDSSPLQSLTYGYDNNNRVGKITDGVEALFTKTYGYDALSRLTSSDNLLADQDYAYDATGNRISDLNGGWGTTTYAYDSPASSNRINSTTNAIFGTTAVGYDPAGNMTSSNNGTIGNFTFAYNDFNRLKSVTKNGVAVGAYDYNVFGQRMTKTAGALLTRYIYDGNSQLLAEHLDNGNVWTNYLWFSGELVGLVRNGSIYYIHSDHLGRPELATDSAKTVVWKSVNEAFGDRNVTKDDIGGLNVGLPGQYYDQESYLWYNINRYYNASSGRYTQVDPIGLVGGINPYAYVGGRPISSADPLGLSEQTPPPNNVPGGPWRWSPDPSNSRGGKFVDSNNNSISWDPEGHWDYDDGSGERKRYDRWGNFITAEQAHNPPRGYSRTPLQSKGKRSIIQRCLNFIAPGLAELFYPSPKRACDIYQHQPDICKEIDP